MPEYTEDQIENLFAHFNLATLYCMRRDMIELINDEVDKPTLEWYDRLLRRINHMIEEKA